MNSFLIRRADRPEGSQLMSVLGLVNREACVILAGQAGDHDVVRRNNRRGSPVATGKADH